MGRERDDRTGKFTTEYPLSEFLNIVERMDMPTTQEVADEVGCSYDLAYRRLKELEEKERVSHRDVGRSFIWSVKDE